MNADHGGRPGAAARLARLVPVLSRAPAYRARQLVVAGTSASAMLVYSAVSALHPRDASASAPLAAGLMVLTGVLFLCSGLFRLGPAGRTRRRHPGEVNAVRSLTPAGRPCP